jgi:predicted P-loop ATPase
MEALKAQREAERREAHQVAAEKAASMWAAARDASEVHHDYLQRKQIPGIGARLLRDQLLVPMRHGPGALVGLQVIQPDGLRKFLTGTPAEGAYTTIGKPSRTGTVVICEGYATGVSIHLATGWCVVVAFSAGNIKDVAPKIRAALPEAQVCIGADDDFITARERGTNPGLEAAAKTGLPVAIPRWLGERGRGTDFNDLHQDEGLDAVRACFDDPQPIEPPRSEGSDKPVSVGGPGGPNNPGSSGTGSPHTPRDGPAAVDEPPPAPPGAATPEPAAGSDVLLPGEMDPAPVMSRNQAVIAWGLEANDKGQPHPSVANVVRILHGDQKLAGAIWFDEFLDRICTAWPTGDVREWTDADDVRLQVYIQETLSMPKLGKQAVQDAVLLVARMDTRNEAAAYLDTLQWDGVERIQSFFPSIFGAEDTEYSRAVGVSFWLSLVARVTRPGCKVDTMVVLEGLQGSGKSRALSIIGGRWFAEATQAPTDKDFYLNLAGKMLVEIGEMDAFNRAEVTKVKQVITCQVDRYRAPYERRAADHPRRCVFAGTTNRDDWNKDETGARRFLPILVGEVKHDVLAQQRDQLFAEALARLNRGENWWTLPAAETLAQQEARRDSDELEARLVEWLIGRSEVSVADVLDDLMKVPLERQDKSIQMRVGKALRAIGWRRETVRRGSRLAKVWIRGGNTRSAGHPLREAQHDDDDPF